MLLPIVDVMRQILDPRELPVKEVKLLRALLGHHEAGARTEGLAETAKPIMGGGKHERLHRVEQRGLEVIHKELKVIPQVVSRVITPPDKEVLPVACLGQAVKLCVQSDEVSAIPCLLFHDKDVLVQLNAVFFRELAKRNDLARLLGRSLQGLDLVWIIIAADEALDDAASASPHLAGHLFNDVAAVVINGELELIVGISLVLLDLRDVLDAVPLAQV
mmetsp:Transcript_13157/g.28451  ORF Transcript_13157/g.28451 Transcript_13157/m.28451 type:complete len:218 (+) Transcript_13157:4547-5200(+)